MLQKKIGFERLIVPGLTGMVIVFLILLNSPSAAQICDPGEIEILFSPEDNCGSRILQTLNDAQESIDLAMYSFTNRILAQGLQQAKLRGVKVRVFMDGENRWQKFSKADYLIKQGIAVRFESGKGLMHNKFCIVDERIVLTGSFNWTVYADLRNDENLTIIKSSEVAKVYKDKFEQLWQGRGFDEAVYSDENRLEKILLH